MKKAHELLHFLTHGRLDADSKRDLICLCKHGIGANNPIQAYIDAKKIVKFILVESVYDDGETEPYLNLDIDGVKESILLRGFTEDTLNSIPAYEAVCEVTES